MRLSLLLAFVAGIACGALGLHLALSDDDANPSESASATAAESTARERKVASLEKKIESLESKLKAASKPMVVSSSDDSDGNKASAAVSFLGKDGKIAFDLKNMQEKMKQQEKERTAKIVEKRLAALVASLGLGDDQAAAVRGLLERQASKNKSLSEVISLATEGGEVGEASIAAFAAGSEQGEDKFNFDSELLSLLEDDQRATYESQLQAQQENYVEATANQHLARLQIAVSDLSEEQKDHAFGEFARLAQEDVEENGVPAQDGPVSFDIRRMMRQQTLQQDALKEVLTEEQLASYQQSGARGTVFRAVPNASVITTHRIEVGSPQELEIELETE